MWFEVDDIRQCFFLGDERIDVAMYYKPLNDTIDWWKDSNSLFSGMITLTSYVNIFQVRVLW